GGGGDDHLGVLLVPGADVNKIGSFRVQHLAIVGVAVVPGDPEEVAEFATGIRMRVSQSAKRYGLIAHRQPSAGVDTGNGAAGDDRCPVARHQSMPSGRSTVRPVALERYAAWTISTA